MRCLDIGCGGAKQEGYVGIDIRALPGVDVVHDLERFPWPFSDNEFDYARCSHVVEHITPHKGVFIEFMNEAWRILKEGAQLVIATPYAGSTGYWQDPTHINPCNEYTFEYFDPTCVNGFYNIYKPKPWKIIQQEQPEGFRTPAMKTRDKDLLVVLIKIAV